MMKNLIVIPARGGSKGIPNKNIYPIDGKPLLEYTIEAAIESNVDGKIVVSTDSDKIMDAAKKYKDIVIVRRPDEISGDAAATERALIHALDFMQEEYGITFENVVTLQPTSPLRTAHTIKDFLKVFDKISDKYDSQLTLTKSFSDYWLKDGDNNFIRLFPNAPRRRQERNPIYIENSAIYVTKEKVLRDKGSVLGNKINGYIISEFEGIDINEYSDIKLVEFIMMNQLNNLN